jgi:hypothetical protein
MSEGEAFPGEFMRAAEAELDRMMMRQVFDFDQGYPVLMEQVDAIVTEAARQRATGAEDIDVLARTFNWIRERHGESSPTMLMTVMAGFAVALSDDRTWGRESDDTERNNP